jgi:DNA-binding response OmpR family regulator
MVVEDDPQVADTVADVLRGGGYEATIAHTGKDALKRLESDPHNLVLVDLTLPDMDGLALVKKLDSRANLGLIIVSGRSRGSDRVIGLDLGADDYIVKPFEPLELLARVRSVLRRCSQDGEKHDSPPLSFGQWTLDVATHRLKNDSGNTVSLTPTEFRTLRVLVEHPNRVLTRDWIMDSLYRNDADAPFDRSVDVTITRLRRKIEKDPTEPKFIRTIRGEGYLFANTGELR